MISRRKLNESKIHSQKGFINYRSGEGRGVELPGLFMYTFDSFLIYDSSKVYLKFFLDTLSYIDAPLYNRYFFNSDLLSLNIRMFDQSASYFFSYFTEMSKHFYDKISPEQEYSQYWLTMLNYWSGVFKIPLEAQLLEATINIDSEDFIDWFPLQVSLSRQGIEFKYPSKTHCEQLKSLRRLPKCNKCRTKNKEYANCDRGCVICKDCWEDFSPNCKTLTCPNCLKRASSELSKDLERKFGLRPLQTCSKCNLGKEKTLKCKKDCWICKECWIDAFNESSSVSCPLCFNMLDSSIYNRIKTEFGIRHDSSYNKKLCKSCRNPKTDFSQCQTQCDICKDCWRKQYLSSRVVCCPRCKQRLQTDFYLRIKNKYNIPHQGLEPIPVPNPIWLIKSEKCKRCKGCKRNVNESLCVDKCYCLDCGKSKYKSGITCCKECKKPYSLQSLKSIERTVTKISENCAKSSNRYSVKFLFSVLAILLAILSIKIIV